MAGACPGARSLTLQNLTTAKEISSGAADFCTKAAWIQSLGFGDYMGYICVSGFRCCRGLEGSRSGDAKSCRSAWP